MDGQKQPRLIRKIGFAYRLDLMPAPFVVGFHQFSKKIEKARFKIRVALVPLGEVTPEIDFLFVPKELEAEAARMMPPDRIFALSDYANSPIYEELLQELEMGEKIYALRIADSQPEQIIVRYRGYERID